MTFMTAECCIYHKPRKFDESDSDESDYERPVGGLVQARFEQVSLPGVQLSARRHQGRELRLLEPVFSCVVCLCLRSVCSSRLSKMNVLHCSLLLRTRVKSSFFRMDSDTVTQHS